MFEVLIWDTSSKIDYYFWTLSVTIRIEVALPYYKYLTDSIYAVAHLKYNSQY